MNCSKCGLEEDEDWSLLVPIQVTVAQDEEGFANITMLLCDEHLMEVTDGLAALGFKDHRHGGINYLEDQLCPGRMVRGGCPMPDTEDDAYRPQGIVLGQKPAPVVDGGVVRKCGRYSDHPAHDLGDFYCPGSGMEDKVYGPSEGVVHPIPNHLTGTSIFDHIGNQMINDLRERVQHLEEIVNTPGPGDR